VGKGSEDSLSVLLISSTPSDMVFFGIMISLMNAFGVMGAEFIGKGLERRFRELDLCLVAERCMAGMAGESDSSVTGKGPTEEDLL